MLNYSGDFIKHVLGEDGQRAFERANRRLPGLATVLAPRTIVSWLTTAVSINYEGEIPGVQNSYIALHKHEDGVFTGALTIGEDVHTFERSDLLHVAASVGVALGLEDVTVDPLLKTTDISKLGKSIDMLVKARVVVSIANEELQKNLESPQPALHSSIEGFMANLKALPKGSPTRGKFITSHMNHAPFLAALQSHPQGKQVHGMLMQHLNSTANAGFKAGQTQVAVKSEFKKRTLDPNMGISFQHQHHDLGGVGNLTHIKAIHPSGQVVGEMMFEHQADGGLQLADMSVHPTHQRQGIASAMLEHGQKVTGKKVMSTTGRTSQGEGFWQNTQKVERPGAANGPKEPKAPEYPQAPNPLTPTTNKQSKQPMAKTMRELVIKKSTAENSCTECGIKNFRNNKFTGCMCFRALAKSVYTRVTTDGFHLSLNRDQWDEETFHALISTLKD